MDSVQAVIKALIGIFVFFTVIKIFMNIAAHIGNRLDFADFFITLWQKIRTVKIAGDK